MHCSGRSSADVLAGRANQQTKARTNRQKPPFKNNVYNHKMYPQKKGQPTSPEYQGTGPDNDLGTRRPMPQSTLKELKKQSIRTIYPMSWLLQHEEQETERQQWEEEKGTEEEEEKEEEKEKEAEETRPDQGSRGSKDGDHRTRGGNSISLILFSYVDWSCWPPRLLRQTIPTHDSLENRIGKAHSCSRKASKMVLGVDAYETRR